MLSKRSLKKFARFMRKLLTKCLKSLSQIKTIHDDAVDAICAIDAGQSNLTQEFTEDDIMQNMEEAEARKVEAQAKAAAVADVNNNVLEQHILCHSFDLIAMPSIEIYPISKRTRFFDQMISKFSRCPLDKLVIMKSFNSADAKHFIGLSFENENAIMIVYANHPLIKHIAATVLKVAKEVEFRWLNLREIEILKSY